MSEEKQDNTPHSASEDFRNKENGGIKNEPKKKKKDTKLNHQSR